MTTTWSITQGSTTVTLPSPPKIVDDNNPPQIDEFGVDGVGTVLISRFNQARKIKLEGSIWVHGQTNANLETNYLAPLRAMSRLQVTITDPDGQFSGNWLMGEPFFHREAEGAEVRYTYSIEFLLASVNVVLSGSGGSNSSGSSEIEGEYTTYTLKSYCPLYLGSNNIYGIYPYNKWLCVILQTGYPIYSLNYADGTTTLLESYVNSAFATSSNHSLTGKYYVIRNPTGGIDVFKEGAFLTHLTVTVSEAYIKVSPNGQYITFVQSGNIYIYEGS